MYFVVLVMMLCMDKIYKEEKEGNKEVERPSHYDINFNIHNLQGQGAESKNNAIML